MLPDLPKAKAEIYEIIQARFRAAAADGVGKIGFPASIVHEGRRTTIIREDGTTDAVEFKRVETSFMLSKAELEGMDVNSIFTKIDAAAVELEGKKMQQMLEKVKEVTSEYGNVVDAKKTGSTLESIFEMLEKIELFFRGDGSPIWPQFVAGAVAAEKLAKALKEIENTPSLDLRMRKLIDRKREEWRARESDRRLVD
jgi:hypothetical protein